MSNEIKNIISINEHNFNIENAGKKIYYNVMSDELIDDNIKEIIKFNRYNYYKKIYPIDDDSNNFHSKKSGLLYMNENKDLVIEKQYKLFSKDIMLSNGAKYFIVDSYENIYNKIIKNQKYEINVKKDEFEYKSVNYMIPKLLNNYYENIQDDKVKLFIDVDYYIKGEYNLLPYEIDKIIKLIINNIIKTINIYLKEKHNIVNTNILILKSNMIENKISLHIVYTNVGFIHITHLKAFFDLISKNNNFNKFFLDFLDNSVYKRGCIRCLYNYKNNKKNMLDYYCHIDNNQIIYEKYQDDYKLFLDSLVCNIDDQMTILNMQEFIKDKKNVKDILKDTSKYLNNISEYKYILDDNFFNKLTKIIKKCDNKKINIKNSKINKKPGWLSITYAFKDLYTHCDDIYKEKIYELYDTLCSKFKNYNKNDNYNIFHSIVNTYPCAYRIDKLTKTKTNIKPLFNYFNLSFDSSKHNSINICSKYIDEYDKYGDKANDIIPKIINHKLIFIKSKPNTGKTYVLKDFINTVNPKSILSIISRTSMTSTHKKSIEILEDYRKIICSSNLIVQLDSLCKTFPNKYKDGVIILDEVHSIISHFKSKTLDKKRIQTFGIFIEILRNAKHVICLDADIADWTIDFIKKITKTDDHILINNTYKNRQNTDVIIYNNIETIVNKMYESLVNCKPFISCFDSKNQLTNIINRLYDKCKENNIKYTLDGSNDDITNHFIMITRDMQNGDIDVEKWANQFVFYSPKIIYGLSFETAVADVFCIATKKILTPLSIYQQIQRCRNQEKVYIYCRDKVYNLEYRSIEHVYSELQFCKKINSILENNIKEIFNKNYIPNYLFDDTIEDEEDIDEDYTPYYEYLYCYDKYYNSMLKSNIKQYLIEICINAGYNIIYDNSEKTNDKITTKHNIDITKFINKFNSLNQDVEKQKDDLIVSLGLDINNLTEFEKLLLIDTRLLTGHFSLYYLFNNNQKIFNKILESQNCDFYIEIVKSNKVKILYIKKVLNILGLNTILDINHNLKNKYKEPIDLTKFNVDIKELNQPFEFNNKYIKEGFNKEWGTYNLVLFLIDMIRNIHPTIIKHDIRKTVDKDNNKISKIVYKINMDVYNNHQAVYLKTKNKNNNNNLFFID